MCVPSSIDPEFVEFYTIHGAIGNALVEHFHPIHVESNCIIDEGGHKVLPDSRIYGSKTVRIVVVQFPITRIATTGLELEGIIISGHIVYSDGRCMSRLPTVIGLNPEADGEIGHSVCNIDSSFIIHTIEECAIPENTSSPLAAIGAREI